MTEYKVTKALYGVNGKKVRTNGHINTDSSTLFTPQVI